MARYKPTVHSPPPLSMAMLWLSCCLALGGCASSRLYPTPTPVETPDLDVAVANPDGVSLTLRRVIRPNKGGSWVRNAAWDEYLVTIGSAGSVPVAVKRAELHSGAFGAPVRGGTSQDELAARSRGMHQTLKDLGLVAGSGIVAAGLAAALAGNGGGYVSAQASAAIVVLPLALIAGTSYVISRHNRAREDRPLIDGRLSQRSLAMPTRLDGAAQVTGSLFFPVIPDPSRLVVVYEVNGDTREISVTLPNHAALHARAVRDRARARAESAINHSPR